MAWRVSVKEPTRRTWLSMSNRASATAGPGVRPDVSESLINRTNGSPITGES